MLRLRRLRLLAGLSQAALSRETGTIHPTTVSNIERGRENPTRRELEMFADALGYKGDPAELTEDVTE